jgi:hypothetical protein
VIKLAGLNATSYIMSVGRQKNDNLQLLQMMIRNFDKGLQQFKNIKKENQKFQA